MMRCKAKNYMCFRLHEIFKKGQKVGESFCQKSKDFLMGMFGNPRDVAKSLGFL